MTGRMEITTTLRRGVAAAALLTAATTALAACSDGSGEEADGPVTVTETVTADPSTPSGTTTTADDEPTGPGTTTPSAPATDDFPTDAQAYAQALIDAWQAGDRDRAVQLVRDPDDADELFDDDLSPAPTFERCEGAAGSSYCTWTGTGYEVVVRVGNEAASAGEPGAISDVEVDD